MAEIPFAFSRPWSFRVPVLTRQMKTEYVEAFFRDGSLRLSSFKIFREHPDELRRDEMEGQINMNIDVPNGKLSVLANNMQEAYIICASTIESSIPKDGSISAFRILIRWGLQMLFQAK